MPQQQPADAAWPALSTSCAVRHRTVPRTYYSAAARQRQRLHPPELHTTPCVLKATCTQADWHRRPLCVPSPAARRARLQPPGSAGATGRAAGARTCARLARREPQRVVRAHTAAGRGLPNLRVLSLLVSSLQRGPTTHCVTLQLPGAAEVLNWHARRRQHLLTVAQLAAVATLLPRHTRAHA